MCLPIGNCRRHSTPLARSGWKFPAKVDRAISLRALVRIHDRVAQTPLLRPYLQSSRHFLSQAAADFHERRRTESVQSEFRSAKTKARRPWVRKICEPQNWRHQRGKQLRQKSFRTIVPCRYAEERHLHDRFPRSRAAVE